MNKDHYNKMVMTQGPDFLSDITYFHETLTNDKKLEYLQKIAVFIQRLRLLGYTHPKWDPKIASLPEKDDKIYDHIESLLDKTIKEN